MELTKILIADDDPLVRDAIKKILEIFGYQVVAVTNGREAMHALNDTFAVIILDINMPIMDGFETLESLNHEKNTIPVLFLTGAGSMEYALKAINLGAYDFLTKPIADLDMFAIKIKRAIEKRMYILMHKAYEENLEFEVKKKTRELVIKNTLLDDYSRQLEENTINTIATLQIALEEKDPYTAGHTKRVTRFGTMIGKAMGLDGLQLHTLICACQIHDIGKLVIDVSCIQRPGPLSPEEWARVTQHPEIGYNILQPLQFLERESTIILQHHERFDGTGYPGKLKDQQLDPLARIVTVADSFDAMTSKRSYKVNKSMEEAIEELYMCSGSQFDPEVVDVFANLLRNQ
ncbi:MAG: response regulator [Desulfobulbaceae bacterium]|nr:response regulator [Desulfobulbaceae bacterium]